MSNDIGFDRWHRKRRLRHPWQNTGSNATIAIPALPADEVPSTQRFMEYLGVLSSGSISIPADAPYDDYYQRGSTSFAFNIPLSCEVGDVLVLAAAGHRASLSDTPGFNGGTGGALTADDGFFAYQMSLDVDYIVVTAANRGTTVTIGVGYGNPTVTAYLPHLEWTALHFSKVVGPANAYQPGQLEAVHAEDAHLRTNQISWGTAQYFWTNEGAVPKFVYPGWQITAWLWGQGDGPGPDATGGNPGDYDGPDYFLYGGAGDTKWQVDVGQLHARLELMSVNPDDTSVSASGNDVFGPMPAVHDPALFVIGGVFALYPFWMD